MSDPIVVMLVAVTVLVLGPVLYAAYLVSEPLWWIFVTEYYYRRIQWARRRAERLVHLLSEIHGDIEPEVVNAVANQTGDLARLVGKWQMADYRLSESMERVRRMGG